MAALPDRHAEALVELRRVSAESLHQLLEEETADWRGGLNWDFRPSAELVRRFVQMHALTGYALIHGTRVVGYSYYVCEEGKGLVGDLFVAREFRTPETEQALLQAVLDALWRTPGIKRIEAQLMMLTRPLERSVPYTGWFRCYPRHFLEAPLAPIAKLPVKNIHNIAIVPWTDNRHDETARLISSSYLGHIDSQINDQYRSPAGARRFLTNIVQYPGCGAFFGPASFGAIDPRTSALYGISLASMVATDVGHVTQVCAAPSHKGIGLGYELLRRSLMALAAKGCRSASLTVTVSNEEAIGLYHRMGFTKLREFAAYVWEPR